MKLVPYERKVFGSSLFRDFFNDDFHMPSVAMIRADVKEDEKGYVVEAEMPGVDKDDVTIVCEKGILTISAERAGEKEEEKDGYIRRERYLGQAKRSFALKDIKEESISARLENGVLYVTLPKLEETQIRKTIEID